MYKKNFDNFTMHIAYFNYKKNLDNLITYQHLKKNLN
jgi:hypothetical protein